MSKVSIKLLFVALISFFLTTVYAATAEQMTGKVADAALTSQIKLLFTQDQLLSPFDVSVTTDRAKVALEGQVDTDMQYERAVALAESVDGVKDVSASNLKITDSKQPMADTVITAKVKGKLLREKMFTDKEIAYWPVKIETKNGVVYLSGSVDNEQQQQNLMKVVRSVDGVKGVKNAVTLGTS